MRLFLCGLIALMLGLAPAARADEPKKADSYQVPFRLTTTQHLLVRAKVNGKGPFNFIIDTGAPALYLGTAAAKKAGVEPDKRDWGVLDRFQLEGGLTLSKFKCRVEDPFQLKGMNGMGLAGVELHGVIGYTVLARFRMEIDLTRDRMVWTKLDHDPGEPPGLGKAGAPPGMDMIAGLMKMLGGMRKPSEATTRGFLGVELREDRDGVLVAGVLAKGPAAASGLQAGDAIQRFQGQEIKAIADVHKLAAPLSAGDKVELTVRRGADTKQITIKAGEGL